MFTFTEKEMIAALECNNYGPGWAGNDWIPPAQNADHVSLTLKEAFVHLLHARNII